MDLPKNIEAELLALNHATEGHFPNRFWYKRHPIDNLSQSVRLIPLTQARLYVGGAPIPPGSRFCVDCLA
jgi:hypothetical protein